MNFKGKLKSENGGTWLSAILITVIVILAIIVIVAVINLAGTSVKTLEEMKKRDTEQSVLSVFD